MKSSFNLVPFAVDIAPEIDIRGDIERQHNQLKIEYRLTGNLAQLIIASKTDPQVRQYDLWQHTCLEFFLGIDDSSHRLLRRPKGRRGASALAYTSAYKTTETARTVGKYWEFNLSPSGHWNVFFFNNYRENIAEEFAFAALPFKVLLTSDSLQLNLAVDLNKIIAPQQNLKVGITAVIEAKNQQLSYWALNHPQPEADFHDRSSFAIAL